MLSSEKKKRGLGLSTCLVVGTLLSVFALFQGIFYTRLLVRMTHYFGLHGPVEQTSLYILSGFGAVGLVSFIGLWLWQKWALYLAYMLILVIAIYSSVVGLFSLLSIGLTLLIGLLALRLVTKSYIRQFV